VVDAIRPAALAAAIEHTLLSPVATAAGIDRLCAEALSFGFAGVCVHGGRVRRAAERLAGSAVRVAAVVGFPLGASRAEVKRAEALLALDDGAHELDVVLNLGWLREGQHDAVRAELAAIVGEARARGAKVKAILETALLSHEEKLCASRLAVEAGASFVKTSTGFGPGGATLEDVALLARSVPQGVGVKASGGIRDAAFARALLAAGATRLGTSASLQIVAQG
jgi:deoxyribose-phosphate aldolase